MAALLLVLSAVSVNAENYVVKSGDVLWKIARNHGTTWEGLAKSYQCHRSGAQACRGWAGVSFQCCVSLF